MIVRATRPHRLLIAMLSTCALACAPELERGPEEITLVEEPEGDETPDAPDVEGDWSDVGELPSAGPAVTLFRANGRLWAIAEEGHENVLLSRTGAGWERAGELPEAMRRARSLVLVEGAVAGELWSTSETGTLWRTSDGAATWTEEQVASPQDDFRAVERIWRQGEEVYMLVGSTDAQLVRLWRREGDAWSFVHDKGFMIVDYIPLDDVLVHSMRYGWLSTSRDGGETWQPILDGPQGRGWAPTLYRTDDALVAIARDGVWRAGLDARDWERVIELDAGTSDLHRGVLHVHDTTTQSIVSIEVASLAPGNRPVHALTVTPTPDVTAITSHADGIAIADARGNVWETRDAESGWRHIPTMPTRAVELAADGATPLALSATGSVHALEDGRWSGALLHGVRLLVDAPEGALAADALRIRHIVEGREVDAVPLPPGFDEGQMRATRDALIWAPRAGAPMRLERGREGAEWSAIDSGEAWSALEARGAHILALSKGTLWRSRDHARTWETTDLPAGCEADALAVGEAHAWVGLAPGCASTEAALLRVDLERGDVEPVALAPDAAHATALLEAHGDLHVSTADHGHWALDPVRLTAARVSEPAGRPLTTLRLLAGRVWALDADGAIRALVP